jgi:Fe-S-cluster containining protein
MAWTRHGSCNGCGFCCTTFARQAIVRDAAAVADPAFYRVRGFTPMTVDGAEKLVLFAWLQAECPEHVDGGCRVYDDRPQTCRAFPTVPADIVDTPCSYWFEDGAARVGGTGSPHAATVHQLLAIEAGA